MLREDNDHILDLEKSVKNESEDSLEASQIFKDENNNHMEQIFVINNKKVVKRTSFYKTKNITTEIE